MSALIYVFLRSSAFFGTAILAASFIEPGSQLWQSMVGGLLIGAGSHGWRDK